MKKYIKILGVAIIIGGILAYFFYSDIKEEVEAISKKEEVIEVFQAGVYKDYDNAKNFASTLESSYIYKDEDYYRVIMAVCHHHEVKLKLEMFYNENGINYYIKEMRVNKKLIEEITNYENILLKSEKSEVINNINNTILNIFSSYIN